MPGVPGLLEACAPVRHLCGDAELQSPKPFQLNARLFPWQGDAAFLRDDELDLAHNPVSRLARPHRHHRSVPAPGPPPASPRAAGTREEPVSLSPSRSPPPSLSPAAPGPAAPGSRRDLAAAWGKRALWLPTAARLEEKARISWPEANPSRLLPDAESLGDEGGLFPIGLDQEPGLPLHGAAAECARKQEAARIWALLLAVPKSPPPLHPTCKQNLSSGRAFGQHRDVPLGAGAFSPTMGHGDDGSWVALCHCTGTLGRAILQLPGSTQPHDRSMLWRSVSRGHNLQLPVQNQAAANSPCVPRLNPHTDTWKRGCKSPSWDTGSGQLTYTARLLPAQMSLLLPADGAAEAGTASAPTLAGS